MPLHPELLDRLTACAVALSADEVPACPHMPSMPPPGVCSIHPAAGVMCRACWAAHAEESGELFGRTCNGCDRATAGTLLDSHLMGRVILYGFGALCSDCEPLYPAELRKTIGSTTRLN